MDKINTEKTIHKIKCKDCEKMIPETYIMENYDGKYCFDCWLSRHGHLLIDYGYKPTPRFSKISFEKNPLFLGIELEVEAGEDNEDCNEDSDEDYDDDESSSFLKDYAYDIMKDYPCYIKYDGSLDRSGMEIVTHPQTVKHHKRVFNWKELLERLKKDGFTSYTNNRCGLHIHLSKSFFKPEDYLKFNIIFDKNYSILKKFSKRTRVNYCNKIKAEETRVIARDKKHTRIEAWYDHYKSIYFGNSKTIEIRIYRGTLEIERFNATLDLTEALAYFVKSYSLAFFIKANKKQLWYSLLTFMQQAKRYYKLLKYLEKEKLLYCELNNIPRNSMAKMGDLKERDLLTLMGNQEIRQYLKEKVFKKLKYYFEDFEDYTISNRNDVYYIGNNFIPINFEEITFQNNCYNAQKRQDLIDFFLDYGFVVTLHDKDTQKRIKNKWELAETLGINLQEIKDQKEARAQKQEAIRLRRERQSINVNTYSRLFVNSPIGSYELSELARDWERKTIRRRTRQELAKRANRHFIFKIKKNNQ